MSLGIALAPDLGGTIALTANGTTSVNVALAKRYNGVTLRCVNLNTIPAFLRAGVGAQTATTADAVIPPNGVVNDIYVGSADNVAIVLGAAGTAVVYVTPGN